MDKLTFFQLFKRFYYHPNFNHLISEKLHYQERFAFDPEMSHPYESRDNEIMYLMHEKSRATKIKCKSIFKSDSLFNRKTFRNQLWPQLDRLGKLNYSHIKS